MKPRAPHFLLFSESKPKEQKEKDPTGQWRFVLEAVDGSSKMEAADKESRVSGERLDLLAVVRGLEALDQPSRVTLVTPSRYVSRGFRHGLQEWRENDFQWESFGQMTPVKNGDLWQRIDRALDFHQVECRTWRFDPPEESTPASAIDVDNKTDSEPCPQPERKSFVQRISNLGRKIGIRFSKTDQGKSSQI